MASAAAVAANAAASPPRNTIGLDTGAPGEITSAIGTKDDIPGLADHDEDEEEDDDDGPMPVRRRGAAVNGHQADEDDEAVGDDLFGDGDGGARVPQEQPAKRQLDDDELDSGDDVEQSDRVAEGMPEEEAPVYETHEKITMDVDLARQPLPEPSDGEVYLMKVPKFLEIDPSEWDHQNFQPPTTDHHSTQPPTAAFSAFSTAMTSIRWRHSPSNPAELQSNARILRWSDGSLTLQLASEPTIQYEIDGNSLAPPQRNPPKPTPVSIRGGTKIGRQGAGGVPGEKYDQSKDAFTYLVVPHETESLLRVAHKITAGLAVRQSESVQDDAIERLEADLAKAANATKVNGAGSGMELQLIDEDPEAARRKAENDMRKIEQSRRKREAAIERENERSNRVLGRSGLSSGRSGGLNVGLLEDDELGGSVPGRGRGRAGAAAKKRSKRRSSVYSSDEDMGRRHFGGKEDEYDEEDDFVAGSDEEEEVDDDEDPDDGIVEELRHGERDKERVEKRPVPTAPEREVTGDDAEADAEGEVDEDVQQQASRTKRRRVVDEDEDEE